MRSGSCIRVLSQLLSLMAAAICAAAPVRVSEKEETLWKRWLIPLPKEVSLRERVEIPVSSIRVRQATDMGPVGVDGAAMLSSWLREKAGNKESDARFEILFGICDGQGKLQGTVVPGADRLATLPNAAQAYVIRPLGEARLALAAISEQGLHYAAVTLRQLLEGRIHDGRAEMPLALITDWPDLAERGEWGGNINDEIEWMAGHKLNLVESHVKLEVTADGKAIASADAEQLKRSRLCALKYVPIITHLDQLERTGIYDVYPELRGKGRQATRPSTRQTVVAPCLAQPKLAEILASWMAALASQEGVTDICAWLSEFDVQCGCDECRKGGQHVQEARTIVKAWRTTRRKYPKLGLRILLTQGSYPENDGVLAEIPEDAGVTYYDGRRTYDSSREPMIYPLLEAYAAKGRWLGCYPQLTASWRIVCPWSGPQFIRFRMQEFVQKKLACLCGYATPNNRLYDFNITAAAEWSWNVGGRDEREFAAAWATRLRLKDPDAAAEWAVLLGPVGWDVYGSGIPYPHFFGTALHMVEKRTPPKLGEGMFRYFPTIEHIEADLAVTDKALKIAERLDSSLIITETMAIQGYVRMIKEIHEIAELVSTGNVLSESKRGMLRMSVDRLFQAGVQTTTALRDWEHSVGSGLGKSRFADTVEFTSKTATQIGEVVKKNILKD